MNLNRSKFYIRKRVTRTEFERLVGKCKKYFDGGSELALHLVVSACRDSGRRLPDWAAQAAAERLHMIAAGDYAGLRRLASLSERRTAHMFRAELFEEARKRGRLWKNALGQAAEESFRQGLERTRPSEAAVKESVLLARRARGSPLKLSRKRSNRTPTA